MIIVPSTVQPPISGGGLFETEQDREHQRRAMLALLRRWGRIGSPFDAIDLGHTSPVDYLIVAEGSYLSGPLPRVSAGQVEYKRRKGRFTYPDLFVEDRKWMALVALRQATGGVPIFVAEWDDVVLLWDPRNRDACVEGWMERTDRGRRDDTDHGLYVPSESLSRIPKGRNA